MWFLEVDQCIKLSKKKVALILNNCSAHHSMPKLSSVKAFFLLQNTTADLQPIDAGVIANFRRSCIIATS